MGYQPAFLLLAAFSFVFSPASPVLSLSPKTLLPYQSYFWNGLDYSFYTHVRDGRRDRMSVASYFVTNQLYFGYGIYPRLNALILFNAAYTRHENDSDLNLGDGWVGVKYEALKQEHQMMPGIAVLTAVRFPLSRYDPNKENAIGEGWVGFDFGLILGYSTKSGPLPISIAFGPGYRYRLKSGSAPDQFFLASELSVEATSYLGLKLKSDFHYSLSGIDYRGEEYEKIFRETGKQPIPELRSVFSNLVLEIEYHLSSHVTLGCQFGRTLYSINAPELYLLGLSYGRSF